MHIIIACFPKSGSTYFCDLLYRITEFEMGWWFYHTADDSPQPLYEPRLQTFQGRNTVTQQHLIATDGNLLLIKKYNLKIVVHVRNIFDALISLYDHIEKHRIKILTGDVSRRYFTMTRKEKLDYLIGLHLPFYFAFYGSWLDAAKSVPVIWTSYEEMVANPVATAQKVLRFHSLEFTDDRIRQMMPWVDPEKTRFNKGVPGRGESLSEKQKDEVRRLARLHGLEDDAFKMIGIDSTKPRKSGLMDWIKPSKNLESLIAP